MTSVFFPIVSRSWFAVYHDTLLEQVLSRTSRPARSFHEVAYHKSNSDSEPEYGADSKCASKIPTCADGYTFVLDTDGVESEDENVEKRHNEVDKCKSTCPHDKAENRRITH